jgi:hypothetical protein
MYLNFVQRTKGLSCNTRATFLDKLDHITLTATSETEFVGYRTSCGNYVFWIDLSEFDDGVERYVSRLTLSSR